MQNLNLYMRAVAVTSLIVVGGVGVYKGRGMLGGKKADAKETAEAGKEGESKPAAPAPDKDGKVEPPKPGSALSSIAKATNTTPDSTAKPAAEKKSGSFKFGGFGKSKENETSTPAAATASTPSPAAPKTLTLKEKLAAKKAASASKVSEYAADIAKSTGSLSDGASPASSDYGGDSTYAPPAESGDNYGGLPTEGDSYGGSPAAPADLRGPAAMAGVASEYGAPTGPATDLGVNDTPAAEVPVEEVAPPSPGRVPASDYGSLPNYGTTDEEPRPNTLADTEPVSPAIPRPTDRTGGGFGATADLTPPPRTSAPAVQPLDAPLASERAATSGRYAAGVDPQTDDITPIGSSTPLTVEPHMEGPQAPSLSVQKYAPEEVHVGKPALFEIEVRNVGKVAAYDVTVVDEVPKGTRLAAANPQPQRGKTGALTWKLGTLKPGETQVIELQLVPETEGEIGSVAQVSFQAQAASKSVVTKARLDVKHTAPTSIHAGETAQVAIVIGNNGSGAATNVVLQCDVPQGFSHPQGTALELAAGTIRPGETKEFKLQLKAEQAGKFQAVFDVQADGDLSFRDAANIEIVAPSLEVQLTGPKKRAVERQATHEIKLANPGTAAAKGIDLVAYLPRGLKFVSADNRGQFDARQNAVIWALDELPASAAGSVQLTTLPIEAGDQKLRIEAKSANGLTANFEQVVSVDAVAELTFSVHDLADPIEVGSDTVYEVRISNRGSKDATNVQTTIVFPKEMRPLAGEGDAGATVNGQKVTFAAIGRITPGQEATLKVRGQGLRPGDHRIAVSVASDESATPVMREESTRVYADQ